MHQVPRKVENESQQATRSGSRQSSTCNSRSSSRLARLRVISIMAVAPIRLLLRRSFLHGPFAKKRCRSTLGKLQVSKDGCYCRYAFSYFSLLFLSHLGKFVVHANIEVGLPFSHDLAILGFDWLQSCQSRPA